MKFFVLFYYNPSAAFDRSNLYNRKYTNGKYTNDVDILFYSEKEDILEMCQTCFIPELDIKNKHFFQNSIRHNLSLHSRFIRVQNEGTGKSSWWMMNPDAKAGSGKNSRRRTPSIDTAVGGPGGGLGGVGGRGPDHKRRGRTKKNALGIGGLIPGHIRYLSVSHNIIYIYIYNFDNKFSG